MRRRSRGIDFIFSLIDRHVFDDTEIRRMYSITRKAKEAALRDLLIRDDVYELLDRSAEVSAHLDSPDLTYGEACHYFHVVARFPELQNEHHLNLTMGVSNMKFLVKLSRDFFSK